MIRIKLCMVFILLTHSLLGQKNILDKYIKIGLESNLALEQQGFTLEQSLQALREAQGLFFPSISVQARYTRAGGGRQIEYPVGSIVNPIYSTLNEILGYLGQQPKPFPVIDDQVIPFLREKEHDTKLRLLQPLFQPAIYFNYALKSDLNDIQLLETRIFQRELIKNIKLAYFNYLRAFYVSDLFAETKLLLQENLRVSQKLYAAQKVTQDAVYRAESELSAVEQQQMETLNNLDVSKSYFNFLLNRPLPTEIEIDTTILTIKNYNFTLDTARTFALNNREELVQLQHAISAANNNRKISSSKFYPGLSAVVDYGFEGEEYRFDQDHDYWAASLVLEWNIFNGFQDQARVQNARLEKRKLESRYEEIKKQLEVQVREAYNNFMLAQKKIEVADKQALSSEASFVIINKKYNQGMSPMVEFLDARTNMTRSQINRILSNYDYHARFAELERVISYYTLPETEGDHED